MAVIHFLRRSWFPVLSFMRISIQVKTVPTLWLVIFSLMWSCSGTKHLTKGQYLYKGAEIKYVDESNIPNFQKVNYDLEDVLNSRPNFTLLGMRPFLCLYNTVSEPKKKKGFRHWLKYKIGQPPILYDQDKIEKISRVIENRLYNFGHFNVKVQFELDSGRKTVFAKYFVKANPPFLIHEIHYPNGSLQIEQKIDSLKSTTLLKPNNPYDLTLLRKERDRLEASLKNLGYYNFNQEYLVFRADSTLGNHKINLYLQFKPETPLEIIRQYRIHDITIYNDVRTQDLTTDSATFQGMTYFSNQSDFRPDIAFRSVAYRPGSIYSKDKQLGTNNYFMGLGAFKYANTRFSQFSDSLIDASIFLTRNTKYSLSSEINVVSKTNNFAGPGLRFTYRMRNVFKGSEIFYINVNGRFEKQYAGENQGDLAYELSTDFNFDIPRIVPFKSIKPSDRFVPHSRISIGLGLFDRQDLYQFNTSSISWSYSWRKNQSESHELHPVDFSFTNLAKSSNEFQDYLDQNPSLKRSFEDQFILGSSYDYTLNHLQQSEKSPVYFSAGIDASGNLITLLNHITSGKQPTIDDPFKVMGLVYSQFVRLKTDFRYYFKLNKQNTLATRLLVGVGLPIGNSQTMPYVRQFFVGGTNSVRAFLARSVGPGTYFPPDSLTSLGIDQAGDMNIEANAEYRFPIVGYFKGAVFFDAGNIWLINKDENRPGGTFSFNTFYKEFAIGTGLGLRIDLNVVVIRFDWAFPLRKPWLDEGNRWVIKDIDFFNSTWRKQNLILNFSVGYSF